MDSYTHDQLDDSNDIVVLACACTNLSQAFLIFLVSFELCALLRVRG